MGGRVSMQPAQQGIKLNRFLARFLEAHLPVLSSNADPSNLEDATLPCSYGFNRPFLTYGCRELWIHYQKCLLVDTSAESDAVVPFRIAFISPRSDQYTLATSYFLRDLLILDLLKINTKRRAKFSHFVRRADDASIFAKSLRFTLLDHLLLSHMQCIVSEKGFEARLKTPRR